jgi:peptidoglycan/LPS O-acetylase OafA/YrhL
MMETSQTFSAMRYRPEIDGLRAVAVMAVILYHARVPGFAGGFVGVDVFFVISGYLITAILLREIGEGRFTFGGFYERRARRLLPALLVVVALTSIAALFVLTPDALRPYGQSVFATMAFASNIYFYLTTDYFNPATGALPLLHMWSLAVEEQFYLAFPVVLLVGARLGRRGLLVGVALLALASFAASVLAQRTAPTANFFLPHTRAWELLAGALLAFGAQEAVPRAFNTARWPQAVRAGGEMLGALLLIAAIALFDEETVFPGINALLPVFGSVLIVACSAPDLPLGRVLASPPAVGIGLISYSAYLWHQPLFAFVLGEGAGSPGALAIAGLIAASLGLAWMTWRYVETPFRDRKRMGRRTVFAAALSGSFGFAAMGLALHFADGVPQRYPTTNRAVAETRSYSPFRDTCHTSGTHYLPPSKGCTYGGERISWAVLGDSHGIAYAHALSEHLLPRGEGVLHLTFSGCSPLERDRIANAGCARWTRDAIGVLKANEAIDHVVLAYRHPTEFRAGEEHAYWHRLGEYAQALAAAGKQVVLLETVPELPRDAGHYIWRTDFEACEPTCITGPTVEEYRSHQRAIGKRLSQIAARDPAITVLPTGRYLCEGGQCASIRDSTALYLDDNHLSAAGARFLVERQAKAGELTGTAMRSSPKAVHRE